MNKCGRAEVDCGSNAVEDGWLVALHKGDCRLCVTVGRGNLEGVPALPQHSPIAGKSTKYLGL